jgi:hypothetical protein
LSTRSEIGREDEMRFLFYASPLKTGWLGWVEDEAGKVTGFVRLNGRVVPWPQGV